MFSGFKKSAFLFAQLILLGCHTIPHVESEISWRDDKFDTECVKKAIEDTKGVKFDHISSEKGAWHATYSSNDFVTYRVPGNRRYDKVEIGVIRQIDSPDFYHHAVGDINTKMSDEDKSGFEKAIRDVSESLKVYCPSLEKYSEPVKSKEWFLFQ